MSQVISSIFKFFTFFGLAVLFFQACEQDLKKWLEKQIKHPVATNVDELKGVIKIKGADRSLVEKCLYEFGF